MTAPVSVTVRNARFERDFDVVTAEDCTLIFEHGMILYAFFAGAEDRKFPVALLAFGLCTPSQSDGMAAEIALNDPDFLVVSVPEFAVYLPVRLVEQFLTAVADTTTADVLGGDDVNAEWARLDGAW
jgi:hypothetical protein